MKRNTNPGKLIVLEGTDGSGKTTQFEKLVGRLNSLGLEVVTFDFPQYESGSSYFARQYLTGLYGTWEEVGPYKASVFYAVDRFAAAKKIKDCLERGATGICNRYVASNMGHQGAKIEDREKRLEYFRWLDNFEYGIMGMPRAHVSIVLHVPADIAQKLVDKKGSREYIGGVKRDIHEEDIKHLQQAERAYLEMVETFPEDFLLIECVEKGRFLSPEEIHEKVWQEVLDRANPFE